MASSPIVPSPVVETLPVYVAGRSIESVRAEFGIQDILKLASNENPLGPGKAAIRALADAARSMAVYPDGLAAPLLPELSRMWDWPAEGILVGNGSDEIFVLLAQAFLGPGRRVLVSEHTFSEYGFASKVVGAQVEIVPMSGYHYDLAGFLERIEGISAVFLCNPNNPTGTHHGHEALASFLRQVPASTLVVLDQAYAEYVETDPVQARELLAAHPNLVVTRTFSKIHGLAAARVGYMVASTEIVASVRRVKAPFNVNGPAQAAALAALSDRGHVLKSLETNRKGKIQLMRGLRDLGLKPVPTEGNFVFCPIGRDAAAVMKAMMQRGVILRATGSFGFPQAIRITVGKPSQNRRLLQELRTVLESIPPEST
ncbi:MAG: histidinol-phosphate transaminase [Fibrobacteria bacterium]|nr:histidinol-phosphate transaminase [Fibrobacteria bacterium]